MTKAKTLAQRTVEWKPLKTCRSFVRAMDTGARIYCVYESGHEHLPHQSKQDGSGNLWDRGGGFQIVRDESKVGKEIL